MQRYPNLDGNSCVSTYQIGHNYILVGFSAGNLYAYTYASTGRDQVETMKACAREGRGLGTFIGRNVQQKSSRKLSSFLGRIPSPLNLRLKFV